MPSSVSQGREHFGGECAARVKRRWPAFRVKHKTAQFGSNSRYLIVGHRYQKHVRGQQRRQIFRGQYLDRSAQKSGSSAGALRRASYQRFDEITFTRECERQSSSQATTSDDGNLRLLLPFPVGHRYI
jgi:hypothetical protein